VNIFSVCSIPMVYYKRKRTATKTAANKRRRVAPKRKPRMPTYAMRTVKTTYQGTWQFSTAATSGFWKYYEAQAIQMSEFSEFATIFDEYKITNLKYTFRPKFDGYAADPATAGPLCYAHVIKDPASTRIPNGAYSADTINQFLENGSVKSHTLTKPMSVSFRPKILTADFGGGTASTAIASRWIRTTEDGIPHRGFHMFLQNNALASTNGTVILDVFVTYTIMFRGAR